MYIRQITDTWSNNCIHLLFTLRERLHQALEDLVLRNESISPYDDPRVWYNLEDKEKYIWSELSLHPIRTKKKKKDTSFSKIARKLCEICKLVDMLLLNHASECILLLVSAYIF